MPYKNPQRKLEYNREYNRKYYGLLTPEKRKSRIKQIKKSQRKRARINKRILVDEMGGKCQRCPENRIMCLQFHHNEGKKEKEIGYMLSNGYGISKLREEAKKCILLCANCHTVEHNHFSQ